MNAQTLDILAASDFTYCDAPDTPNDSVAHRLDAAIRAGNYYVRQSGELPAFWTAVNGLTVDVGSTIGTDKGLGTCGVVNCIGASGYTDISSYILGLDGGCLLTTIGVADMALRGYGLPYDHWGTDSAAMNGIKSFLTAQKRLGKTIIWCSSYPAGTIFNGYLEILYAEMETWLKRNGMFFIDLYSWCPQETNGFLPVSWLDSNENYHLGATGSENIATYLYGQLAAALNSAGMMT